MIYLMSMRTHEASYKLIFVSLLQETSIIASISPYNFQEGWKPFPTSGMIYKIW